MNERAPSNSGRMLEIIRELCREHDISSVVEVGCGAGMLVDVLRERGFDAYGIEVNEKSMLGRVCRQDYLRQGNAAELRHFFGEQRFDLVIANWVMCAGAVGGLVLSMYGSSERILSIPEKEEMARKNNERILKSAHGQLRHGGFFVAVEDPGDRLAFTREDAARIGYEVVRYSPHEAVLRRNGAETR